MTTAVPSVARLAGERGSVAGDCESTAPDAPHARRVPLRRGLTHVSRVAIALPMRVASESCAHRIRAGGSPRERASRE